MNHEEDTRLRIKRGTVCSQRLH